ncbi:hypothetical protein EZV62_007082 [Acer yangbiense]|uniref:Uncharacterized protein n=1 Tax=Acer yangbiense TaxID=1000413 RepID=A0A5C7I9H0_9ROSI|nr:hypothetical protein EZV62_007082 [Acer yangbiense]
MTALDIAASAGNTKAVHVFVKNMDKEEEDQIQIDPARFQSTMQLDGAIRKRLDIYCQRLIDGLLSTWLWIPLLCCFKCSSNLISTGAEGGGPQEP